MNRLLFALLSAAAVLLWIWFARALVAQGRAIAAAAAIFLMLYVVPGVLLWLWWRVVGKRR